MAKFVASIVLGAASLGLVAQPAGANVEAKRWSQPHLNEITAAMESAGFAKCHEDTPRTGDASGNYAHWSWDFVVGQPCPAYDSTGFAQGPLDAKLSILPYSACGTMKRAIANYYGNAHYIDQIGVSPLGTWRYGSTILSLDGSATPAGRDAAFKAMRSLKAGLLFDGRGDDRRSQARWAKDRRLPC